ncbi:MAG TPA: ribonuclease III domain-containing protein [Bacteriovoracaceae bacterium]|nr:ribonuclease III domain-containing protein [Bacteriovoracaceae bacterium]
MSHPRLQQMLAALFEQKDPALLQGCLTHPDYDTFQALYGLTLPQEELLRVFTHTSFTHEFNLPNQEQLEFLGDAVVQLILTDELCRLFPQEKEGRLSKLRSAMVNEKTLALIASQLKLGELLLVGRGEYIKKLPEQDAVLADTLEALLGQVYRHHGFDFTRGLLLVWLKAHIPGSMNFEFLEDFDAKSRIQELSLGKYKKLPRYTAEALGEKFEVKLWINEEMLAAGVFSSKKNGEKELAAEVLKKKII